VSSALALLYSIMPGLAMAGRRSCGEPAERIPAARRVIEHHTAHALTACMRSSTNDAQLRVEHGQYEGTQTILVHVITDVPTAQIHNPPQPDMKTTAAPGRTIQ